ncbi:TPA: hypothetical protein DCE37_26005 [Candidatus Latescibacteria bacterium]|nr:hypothetical protein [Candidatus Latescibacterota bacterium]|tara:strand:+ start:597 stop:1223 length:627 start_codon:yes stop_codon:yes gene_type:complete
MNFRTATLVVLGMFGSFAVVITAMILLFWSPKANKAALQTQESAIAAAPEIPLPEVAESPPDRAPEPPVVVPEPEPPQSAPEQVAPARVPEPSPKAKNIDVGKQAPAKPTRAPGRATQKNLQVEQDEMKLLKAEMQRRLNRRIQMRERKLDQLARQCGNLTAGEAVQILVELDDTDLKHVLERMDREQAVQIAALLTRLGRSDAISIK